MKRFFFLLLLFICLPLAIVGRYNYMHDELGILHPKFSGRRFGVAENFVKTRYILGNPDKYNAFCFGSSRVGVLDLEKMQDGNRWYNMTYPEGSPQEFLQTIRYFLKGGVKIKKLMIGLDDASFRVDPEKHIKQFGDRYPYKPYDAEAYLRLLFQRPQRLKTAAEREKAVHIFDIYKTGNLIWDGCDAKIDADPDGHRKDGDFLRSYAYEEDHMQEALAAIREICRLAKENGIETVFFINPVYQTTYLDTDGTAFDTFKEELAKITDYYDFSGLNEASTDAVNFYDGSHYRPFIGDRILAHLTGKVPANSDGFGSFVTAAGAEAHVAFLDQQLKDFQAQHPALAATFDYSRRFTTYRPVHFSGKVRKDITLFCHLDTVNKEAPPKVLVWQKGTPLKIDVWQLPGAGTAEDTMFLLRRDNGEEYGMKGRLVLRDDVHALMHRPGTESFGASIDTKDNDLPSGEYMLSIMTWTSAGDLLQSTPLLHVTIP